MFLAIIAPDPDIMAFPKFSPVVESLRVVPVKPSATWREISLKALSASTLPATPIAICKATSQIDFLIT